MTPQEQAEQKQDMEELREQMYLRITDKIHEYAVAYSQMMKPSPIEDFLDQLRGSSALYGEICDEVRRLVIEAFG